MKTSRFVSAVAIAAIILAGCGGHSGSMLPQAGSNKVASRGTLAIKVTVPVKSPNSSVRHRQYVSFATQSFTVAIDGGSPQAFGLTRGSQGCVANAGNTALDCTVSVAIDTGRHSLTFKTYDGTNGTGSLLSLNSNVPITISGGQTNTVSLTLNAVVASLQLVLADSTPPQGTTTTIALSVNAYDVDGNLIVGPGTYYGGPVLLSDSDSSGATSLSTTAIIQPSDAVSVNYNGSTIPGGSATFSASIGNITTAGSQNAVLTPVDIGSWQEKAPMPTARWALAAGSIGQTVYAAGGLTAGHASSLLEAYSVSGNTWSEAAPMPGFDYDLGAAVVNGSLYTFGGIGAAGVLNTVQSYDPNTNTWTTRAPMPTARYNPAVAVVNGIVYVAGGNGGSGAPVGTVEAYDPSANTWTERAALPVATAAAGAEAINGILYVVGGGVVPGNQLQAYNAATNTWTLKSAMPTGRGNLAAAQVNGILYAMGGNDDASGDYLTTTEAYDPTTDTWKTVASMPTARSAFAVAVVNGVVYAVGGTNGLGPLNTVEAFTP